MRKWIIVLIQMCCIQGCVRDDGIASTTNNANDQSKETDMTQLLTRYVGSDGYDRSEIIDSLASSTLLEIAEKFLEIEQDPLSRRSIIYKVARTCNNTNHARIDDIILRAIYREDSTNIKAGEISIIGMVSPGQHNELLWYLAHDSRQEMVIRQHAIDALGFSTDKETLVKLVEFLPVVKDYNSLVLVVFQSLARMTYGYEMTNVFDVKSVVDLYYSVGESHAPLWTLSAYVRLTKDKQNNASVVYQSGMKIIKDKATDVNTLRWVVSYAIGLEDSLGPAPPDDPILAGYLKVVLSDALGSDFSGLANEDWKRQLREIRDHISGNQYRWSENEQRYVFIKPKSGDTRSNDEHGEGKKDE